jgi:MFS family permease
MGGEWAAGAVLVSETWPAQHRTKAICIVQSGFAPGYVLAAALAALILDVLDLGPEAWRWLFAAGAVPALFVWWVARHVREPALWIAQRRSRQRQASRIAEIFGPSLRRRTVLLILLTSSIQFAYWGLFFWLPQFLARPVDQGGAGMTLVGTMWWIVVTQIGAYVGYLSFGVLAERLGRTRTFILFMIAAAVIVPVYSSMAASRLLLMVLSPLLGYVGHGYFSAFGSMIAELYPTPVRGTGQGLTYNAGRLLGAFAPYVVGTLTALFGIGGALWVTSAFFLMSALLIVALPDRSGMELED